MEIHLNKNGKSSIDINKVLASPDKDTLIYLCGPTGFIKWIEETALTIGWNKNQIKQEFFSGDKNELTAPKDFKLTLKKSNKSIQN